MFYSVAKMLQSSSK